jgi:hypothetical protein
MLFYAYSPKAQGLTLRRVRIEPMKGGRFAVRVKPAPSRAERVAIYSDKGKLIRKRMADGRVLVPASEQQLRAAWNVQ